MQALMWQENHWRGKSCVSPCLNKALVNPLSQGVPHTSSLVWLKETSMYINVN